MLNVGVLFRNNQDLVIPFFYFLRKSTKLPLRIIALDNGSTDKTRERLLELRQDPDIIIGLPENIGIAQGRNRILQKVKNIEGGYTDLVMMDSDVFIIHDGSLDRMKTLLDYSIYAIVFGITYSFHDFNLGDQGMCFCLISKKAFEQCGEFDPQFSMFCDDTDFVLRVKQSGLSYGKCFTAHALHIWGSTTYVGSEGGSIREEALHRDKELFRAKYPELSI